MTVPPSSTSSSDAGRGRRALRATAIAVALVVAVDALCRVVLPVGWLVESEDFMRARVELEPAPDVQVVGDSVARSGFIASSLAAEGLTVRNDSIAASGPPKSYLLLSRQFEIGNVPKVLVIAHSPHTFAQTRFEVLVGSFAQWSEVPSIAMETRRWLDVLYGVVTRLSYVLMHRDSFRDLVLKGDHTFFTERDNPIAMPPDAVRLAKYREREAAGEFASSQMHVEDIEFYRKPFAVTDINDRYFRKLLALAEARDVRVFWLTMPTPQRVLDARTAVSYERDLTAYLRQFERVGQLTVLKGDFTVYPDRLFRDYLHLNEAGAVRFACEVHELSGPVADAARHRVPGRAIPVSVAAPAQGGGAVDLDAYCGTAGSAPGNSAARTAGGAPVAQGATPIRAASSGP